MLETGIWVIVVILLVGAIIWRADVQIGKLVRSTIERNATTAEIKAIEVEERRADLYEESLTLEARTALENARLEHEAAETRANTAAIGETHAERVAAECRAIEGITDARIARAREVGAADPEVLKLLMKGLKDYNDRRLPSSTVTLEQYLGANTAKLLGH